jgi:hypothetical protein
LSVIPTDEDRKLMEKLASIIVSRRLTAMAIFFLESSKPLSFIGSQFLVVIQPFIQTFLNIEQYDRIAILMEDRDNVELFIQFIENAEQKQVEKKKCVK